MFLGNRGQNEQVTITESYRKLRNTALKDEAVFLVIISKHPEIVEAYERYQETEITLHAEAVFNFYAEDFRFGLLLGTEAAKS